MNQNRQGMLENLNAKLKVPYFLNTSIISDKFILAPGAPQDKK